jgi:hypothetical protein
MVKDPRYKAIKSLIESKSIGSLKDIFTVVPLTVVKNDLKVNYDTFRRKVNNPEILTSKNIIGMAALFEVNPIEVFQLALNDINSLNKLKKK